MGKNERKSYIKAIFKRYHKVARSEKQVILDEFCAVCGIHRKSAIRMLRKHKKVSPTRPVGRKAIYDNPAFLRVLMKIWETSDYMCSKRLKSVLVNWLPFYEKRYGRVAFPVKTMLHQVSCATIDRHLRPIRLRSGKGLSGTRSGSLLKSQIPIRTDNWDIKQPGFLEVDTVAHCGNSLEGDFVWSLVMTDIHTGWTELRAHWNNGAANTLEQMKDIEACLPFVIKGIDSDNGGEFINYHLYQYCQNREEERRIQFTRTRPYKKNDNAHVEQKNWTHVRQLLGYDRIEEKSLVDMINNLYKNEISQYQNFLCPNMKLIKKTRIGSKYKKVYSKPITALERVLQSKEVDEKTKKTLRTEYQNTDPFDLKNRIGTKLKAIFSKVSVTSNVRQRI